MSYGQNRSYQQRGGGRGNYNQNRQPRERRDNDGAVFINKDRKGPTHPDFKGQAMVAGRDYWVSLWVKQNKDGDDFFTLSFQPKDEQRREAPQRPPEQQQGYGYAQQQPPQQQRSYGQPPHQGYQQPDPQAPIPQRRGVPDMAEYDGPQDVPFPGGPDDYGR